MKSIEERALQRFPDVDNLLYKDSNAARRALYIDICKEQRDLDIQKAAEWWESRCDYLGISKYQIELFKKAMEEQS